MRRIYLELTVFICGAVVMAFEIISSRLLGPWVGTSVLVWTSIIGIMLLSLSAGYYLGGRIADRKPRADILAFVIFLAALFIFVTTIFKDSILKFLSDVFSDIHLVSLSSSVVLFMVPSVLLGMVSPFAVRIKLKSIAKSGSTVGNLYAISTAGGISGVFLAGFFLVPSFRISDILMILAIVLMLVSLFLNGIHRFLILKQNG